MTKRLSSDRFIFADCWSNGHPHGHICGLRKSCREVFPHEIKFGVKEVHEKADFH